MSLPDVLLIDTSSLTAANLVTWLEDTAVKYSCTYLLAHAEDGVIWGHIADKILVTSHEIFPATCRAKLRLATLWEARLFGEQAEVLLWRADGVWQARVIQDAKLDTAAYLVETQMLWGTRAEQRKRGFTLLADGAEGLRHAVPIDVPDARFRHATQSEQLHRPVRLQIRHYIDYDSDGNARIALSRLVTVE